MEAFQLIKAEEMHTSGWAGGSTTQLYIHPQQSLFAERDFSFRISTATVEKEESEFTPLPGFERILMILDGELQLRHRDHHSVLLRPFEQYRFSGSWQTDARGKVRDFNIIFKPDWYAEVRVLEAEKGEELMLIPESVFMAYYLFSGEAKLGECKITTGDFMLLYKQTSCIADSDLLLVEVKMQKRI